MILHDPLRCRACWWNHNWYWAWILLPLVPAFLIVDWLRGRTFEQEYRHWELMR